MFSFEWRWALSCNVCLRLLRWCWADSKQHPCPCTKLLRERFGSVGGALRMYSKWKTSEIFSWRGHEPFPSFPLGPQLLYGHSKAINQSPYFARIVLGAFLASWIHCLACLLLSMKLCKSFFDLWMFGLPFTEANWMFCQMEPCGALMSVPKLNHITSSSFGGGDKGMLTAKSWWLSLACLACTASQNERGGAVDTSWYLLPQEVHLRDNTQS